MKTKLRLCLFAVALLATCGSLFTQHFTAAAKCKTTATAERDVKRAAEAPRPSPPARPTLPGMRFLSRGSAM